MATFPCELLLDRQIGKGGIRAREGVVEWFRWLMCKSTCPRELYRALKKNDHLAQYTAKLLCVTGCQMAQYSPHHRVVRVHFRSAGGGDSDGDDDDHELDATKIQKMASDVASRVNPFSVVMHGIFGPYSPFGDEVIRATDETIGLRDLGPQDAQKFGEDLSITPDILGDDGKERKRSELVVGLEGFTTHSSGENVFFQEKDLAIFSALNFAPASHPGGPKKGIEELSRMLNPGQWPDDGRRGQAARARKRLVKLDRKYDMPIINLLLRFEFDDRVGQAPETPQTEARGWKNFRTLTAVSGQVLQRIAKPALGDGLETQFRFYAKGPLDSPEGQKRQLSFQREEDVTSLADWLKNGSLPVRVLALAIAPPDQREPIIRRNAKWFAHHIPILIHRGAYETALRLAKMIPPIVFSTGANMASWNTMSYLTKEERVPVDILAAAVRGGKPHGLELVDKLFAEAKVVSNVTRKTMTKVDFTATVMKLILAATQSGDHKVLQSILKDARFRLHEYTLRGAQGQIIDQSLTSARTRAARTGDVKMFELIPEGGTIWPSDFIGEAIKGGHLPMVRYLHEHENSYGRGGDWKPSHAIREAEASGNTEIIEYLRANPR